MTKITGQKENSSNNYGRGKPRPPVPIEQQIGSHEGVCGIHTKVALNFSHHFQYHKICGFRALDFVAGMVDTRRMASFLDPSKDPNIGSSRGSNQTSTVDSTLNSLGVETSTSAAALLTTFAPSFILFTFWTALFIICRRSQRRFYAPRSYLGNIHEQYNIPNLCPPFSSMLIETILTICPLPVSEVQSYLRVG
ncbi:hypothetical protein PAAG_12151 [Paracoccidioides lutzii Pb01]|uniref:CSC1/OSCA1-like N-terminal transmembrane domain-containing protein n=1 Tax=Paracoccidioides lutzii (strain ATCC MYA-826 / Pb01) TaxID=502779 RepID=A0A0A2V0T9_PARBA|nr:hypothetical protein PAAG_12151 [Paracoccidioides lutzii Pb01]KGQ01113.1 hypothetical protein PAAG_12151 [Paracoccidioides lutzii Pb01]